MASSKKKVKGRKEGGKGKGKGKGKQKFALIVVKDGSTWSVVDNCSIYVIPAEQDTILNPKDLTPVAKLTLSLK